MWMKSASEKDLKGQAEAMRHLSASRLPWDAKVGLVIEAKHASLHIWEWLSSHVFIVRGVHPLVCSP